ncbi:MAG: hypothetical protein M3O02_09100 [Acidobacteriota bacterium]|nr:hypothetical protein [Acidobacteriota bacterium]
MKKLLYSACTAALFLSSTATCLAADSPWNGTWKENLAKSKLTGDTFTITAKPGGAFHLDAGGQIQYDFACDGKSYPSVADRTLTCTGTPAAGLVFVTSINGKVLSKSNRTFSADGKMMMIHGTTMRPDGSTADYDETYKRETGTSGLPGKWLNVKQQQQVAGVETWTVNGSSLHIDAPTMKETIDAKLDGNDGKVVGPTVPSGAAISFKPAGANKLSYTIKLNGKPFYIGTYTLSTDGKTLTDVSWIPGRESEKASVVWDKQ